MNRRTKPSPAQTGYKWVGWEVWDWTLFEEIIYKLYMEFQSWSKCPICNASVIMTWKIFWVGKWNDEANSDFEYLCHIMLILWQMTTFWELWTMNELSINKLWKNKNGCFGINLSFAVDMLKINKKFEWSLTFMYFWLSLYEWTLPCAIGTDITEYVLMLAVGNNLHYLYTFLHFQN